MRALKEISLPHSRSFLFILLLLSLKWQAGAQDWVRTGTNLGAARIRLAAADFNPSSADPQTPALKTTFDSTLYNDLNNAGIFDMVSKSMAPPLTPASPQQMNLAAWAAAPANAAMVAFGSFAVNGGQMAVYGWLFDAKNPAVAADPGQAVQRSRQPGQCASRRASLCRRDHHPPGRRNSGHRRNPHLLRRCTRRKQRDLANGLRRTRRARRSPTWAPSRSRRAYLPTTIASPSPR